MLASLTASISVGMYHALDDRCCDDAHVQRERQIAEVIQVMLNAPLHFFDPIGLAAEAVDLRPTSDTRLDPVTLDVVGHHLLIQIVMLEGVRTRSDDRHIAA